MTTIMQQLVNEYNFNTQEELIDYAKTKLKYNLFQTFLERKNCDPEQAPFCNTLHIFYKGIPLIEYYVDEINEFSELKQYDLLNMNAAKRKKIIFDIFKDEIFFMGEEHALEVLLDDNYYKPRTLKTAQEKYSEVYDC